ncbi:lamin tail domain-containing protein [Streptomyces mauvecolor]
MLITVARVVATHNSEWVTVTNTGRTPVNLKGWTLTDRAHVTYAFRNLRLAGHESVKVHTGKGRDTRRDVYQDRRDYAWDYHAGTATLRDEHQCTIDAKSWRRR